MVNKSKLNLLAIMSDIDIEAARKEAKEKGAKYVSIDFAGQTYMVTAKLQDLSWNFVIKNESMHLSIEIDHGFRAISPEIHAYTHGEEIDRTDQDFIFLELLCYHIEYEIFKRVAKRYSKKVVIPVTANEIVEPIVQKLVRELKALTPKTKRPVWISINNPTTDPSKINSQCTKVLASKKYKGYKPVTDSADNIVTREYYVAV